MAKQRGRRRALLAVGVDAFDFSVGRCCNQLHEPN
jgi:hypothetical protein